MASRTCSSCSCSTAWRRGRAPPAPALRRGVEDEVADEVLLRSVASRTYSGVRRVAEEGLAERDMVNGETHRGWVEGDQDLAGQLIQLGFLSGSISYVTRLLEKQLLKIRVLHPVHRRWPIVFIFMIVMMTSIWISILIFLLRSRISYIVIMIFSEIFYIVIISGIFYIVIMIMSGIFYIVIISFLIS
ncbi:hypothetical protein QYE76_064000 [Lolium multiflorum]|uniref:Uncharacterized protein n=1 Tax=Lolium multiflorum TaxID=4521 RepID=A0AAD8S6Q2_LOLMU|nr:hypothetical protein QYE76_064000 [Lolium multiflorum]